MKKIILFIFISVITFNTFSQNASLVIFSEMGEGFYLSANNYFKVNEAFYFESSISELDEYINKR